jgi:hypothetical protein
MYFGNPQLRKAGEQFHYTDEMMEEMFKCEADIIYFAEHYFHIVTIDEGKRLISLYNYQKKILKAYIETPNGKRHCIVKIARQSGKTTVSSIFLLWYILFQKDKTVAILAHKEDAAIEILDRIKMAYKLLPIWMQSGIVDGGWNKKTVELENGCRAIAAGTGSDTITGFTISLLYMDEFAKVPQHIAEDFITSTYPVISSGKTSKIIIVSTPKGMNHFWEFWTKAVKGTSNFYPIRVGWWEVPGRDEAFKEQTIADIGAIRFAQEFSCKFLGSSSTLIDSDILERIDNKEPINTKWTGLLQIYEEPMPRETYILGVDTAKGTSKDYSVVQVVRIINEYELKQVAVYRNNIISPHDFAPICIAISEYYNKAMMMIENNDTGSSLCDTIWYEYDCDRIVNVDPKALGIRSNRKTKLEANLLLKEYIEKEKLEIVDRQTLYELSRYEEVTNSPNCFACGNNENDDTVTSLLWAVFYIRTDYYEGKGLDIKSIDKNLKISEKDKDDDMPIIIIDD